MELDNMRYTESDCRKALELSEERCKNLETNMKTMNDRLDNTFMLHLGDGSDVPEFMRAKMEVGIVNRDVTRLCAQLCVQAVVCLLMPADACLSTGWTCSMVHDRLHGCDAGRTYWRCCTSASNWRGKATTWACILRSRRCLQKPSGTSMRSTRWLSGAVTSSKPSTHSGDFVFGV